MTTMQLFICLGVFLILKDCTPETAPALGLIVLIVCGLFAIFGG